ncbi:hypothetical protein GWK47_028892 [Chionoecetes opilio]|uniref:MARVEL domain-containing protein n=1 Tax=Chionoecetes opilio TaxID=41210 RepID=A0A8J5D5W4_CHIOP|nr:hypothetical protein GWK47_028892 [Chionoecetes opilio]
MEWINIKQFITSTPSILKLLETAVLLTGMTLFLVGNRCPNIPMFVSLYMLPVVVCLIFILISYTTAVMVHASGRDPLFIPSWAKGESWLNVLAALLMVVGSTLTLTRPPCSDTPLTVFSLALGYICAIMFGCSGVITYQALVHYQEIKGRLKAPKQDAKEEGHIATLAAIF